MRCERVRQGLAKRREFDIEKAFEAVALAVNDEETEGANGTITKDDISSFLIARNFAPSTRQVNLFFSRMDRYGSSAPRLQDFKQELLPRTSEPV